MGNTHGMFIYNNMPWELPGWESQPGHVVDRMRGFIYYIVEEIRSYITWKNQTLTKLKLRSEMVVAKS